MKFSKERKGEALIFSEALLWSLFPVITVVALATLSPLISLGFSALFSALFFAAVVTIRKKWHELTQVSVLKDILMGTLFLGIIYYLLTFFGLQFTSPGNASIIALSEVFFSYLFFNVWQKDKIPGLHLIGAIFISLGVIIIFAPSVKGLQIGDILILAAAATAPFGNFFQRRARTKVSSESILFIRSLISTIFVFLLAILMGEQFTVNNITAVLPILIINGVFLFGLSKIFWIEGIHRISVMKANALNGISPLFTLLFAWLLLQKAPTMYQMLSFVPMFIGVYLLSKTAKSPQI